MNAFEWNGLRVGEAVVVHQLSSLGQVSDASGAVAFVEVRPVRRGGNRVGIRVLIDTEAVVLWPSRGQVDRET